MKHSTLTLLFFSALSCSGLTACDGESVDGISPSKGKSDDRASKARERSSVREDGAGDGAGGADEDEDGSLETEDEDGGSTQPTPTGGSTTPPADHPTATITVRVLGVVVTSTTGQLPDAEQVAFCSDAQLPMLLGSRTTTRPNEIEPIGSTFMLDSCQHLDGRALFQAASRFESTSPNPSCGCVPGEFLTYTPGTASGSLCAAEARFYRNAQGVVEPPGAPFALTDRCCTFSVTCRR